MQKSTESSSNDGSTTIPTVPLESNTRKRKNARVDVSLKAQRIQLRQEALNLRTMFSGLITQMDNISQEIKARTDFSTKTTEDFKLNSRIAVDEVRILRKLSCWRKRQNLCKIEIETDSDS